MEPWYRLLAENITLENPDIYSGGKAYIEGILIIVISVVVGKMIAEEILYRWEKSRRKCDIS